MEISLALVDMRMSKPDGNIISGWRLAVLRSHLLRPYLPGPMAHSFYHMPGQFWVIAGQF